MALLAISSSLVRVVISPSQPALRKPLCKSGLGRFFPILSASISGRAYRDQSEPRPPPFPYKEKKYTLLRSMFDRTTDRFDENSKIVVVEGPVASGKTAFAKELARELDMLHMPEANMDTWYINPYGYDMRELDPKLPESVQSFDEKKFCMNPTHTNVAGFQMWMYRLRFSQYIDALAHLLSTGQGVVLERCPWSDMVFVEAMRKHNYISKEARYVYYVVRGETLPRLLRPHLLVYLDVPVDRVAANIAQRGLPHETRGRALSKAYLLEMENVYKTEYLKDMSEHSELVMYDWSNGGDVEVVVEDIERIDFDKYTKHDVKLRDWKKAKEQVWADTRMYYADQKDYIMSLFNIPLMDAPELVVSGEDLEIWNQVWYSAPGMEYAQGYNPVQGDSNLLFKTGDQKYVPY